MWKRTYWSIWVDWERRVISFHPAPGFAEVRFQTREEMTAFAVQKSEEGFGIQ